MMYKHKFCTAFACPNIIPDIKWGISKKWYTLVVSVERVLVHCSLIICGWNEQT